MANEKGQHHYPKEDQEPGGTLMRAPDGALYFIPDDKLEAFQVPEDKAFLAEKLLYHQDDSRLVSALRGRVVTEFLGIRASGSTTVSVVNLGAIRQWRS